MLAASTAKLSRCIGRKASVRIQVSPNHLVDRHGSAHVCPMAKCLMDELVTQHIYQFMRGIFGGCHRLADGLQQD